MWRMVRDACDMHAASKIDFPKPQRFWSDLGLDGSIKPRGTRCPIIRRGLTPCVSAVLSLMLTKAISAASTLSASRGLDLQLSFSRPVLHELLFPFENF